MVHREVPIRVTAWVDEAIAPVVEAFNGFPEVETFSSCQGDGHVFFHIRGEAQDSLVFMDSLARELAQEVPGCCSFRLQMEWAGEHPLHAALYVEREALSEVAQGLREISRRRTACCGDTARRGADSC